MSIKKYVFGQNKIRDKRIVRGLISSYYLDTNSKDSFRSFNGTDVNVYYDSNGIIDGCAYYNGIDSKTVLGNHSEFKFESGTIACWIKTTGAGSSYRGIFVKNNAYGLYLLDGILVTYDWQNGRYQGTGVNLEDGVWHHVALVFEASSSNNLIYIDGIMVARVYCGYTNQSLNLVLGLGEYNESVQYFKGYIDGAIVSSAQLTRVEITKIYQDGLNGINANT